MPTFVKGEPVSLLTDGDAARIQARVVEPPTSDTGRGVQMILRITGNYLPEGFKKFELIRAHPNRVVAR